MLNGNICFERLFRSKVVLFSHVFHFRLPTPAQPTPASSFTSSLTGPSQPGSGQGSPCGLDQVPSPQSLMGGVTTVKNEQNQVCLQEKNIDQKHQQYRNMAPQ